MTADVDEDPVGLALAVEAGAAAAERQVPAGAPRVPEDLDDVPRVVGHDDDLREAAVGAGVGGVADDASGRASTRAGPAAPRAPSAAAAGFPRPARRARGPARGPCRGARCGGRRARAASCERHAGRDGHLDERGPLRPDALASASRSSSAPRPAGPGRRSARRQRRAVEPRQVQPGRARHLSSSANHLRIAYSPLFRTRNVTGTS